MLEHFENRWQRAIFLACAAAFAAMVAVAVASAARQIGRTSPGFLVWENLVVPALGTGASSGAAPDVPYRSVLIEANAQPVHDAQGLRSLIRGFPPGTPIEYTFLRQGDRIGATIPTARLRWRDVFPVYLPYLLNGLAFFATGLIVFYFRPNLSAAHAGLALSAILGGVLVLAIDTLSSFWLQRLYFCLESLVPGGLLHFALCFPEDKRIVRSHPLLRLAVYLPFVPLALVQNFFLHTAPAAHLAINDWVYSAIAAAGLVSIGSLLHTFWTTRSPLARQRAKIVAFGVVLAAFVPSLGLLSITILGMEIPMNLLAPFFLVYPLSIAYAIARHNLFEVDRFLRLGIVYGALTVVVFLSYATVVLGFERWIGAERRMPRGVVPLYLLAVLLFINPLRLRIQRLVDRLFHRQAYSYGGTVEATSRVLASILDTDRIAASVLETLTDIMSIEWGVIHAFEESPAGRKTFARPPQAAERVATLFPAGDPMLQALLARRRVVTRYDRRGQDDGVDPARLEAVGAALVIPAYFEDEAVGLVVLGEKRSGAFYSDEDLHLIQTLVNQAALALKNARAYEIIRRTQEELVRAERLAVVGQVSAAVAHGIRNPLAGIRAAAQLGTEDVSDQGAVRESLEDIIAEADRLESRIRTLLDFARPFQPKPALGDLNDLVERVVASVRKRLPRDVHLDLELDDALPRFLFDPEQIGEVLEGLIVNAVEAMGKEGRLAVRTKLHSENGAPKEAAFSVSDTGPGMTETQARRVFDLFYTTKASGTGIGLATAKRLIDAHGGRITVESEPGKGATFTVHLGTAVLIKGNNV